MAELTNEQIAEKLREIAELRYGPKVAEADLVGRVRESILNLADTLQPKPPEPEFEDWYVVRDNAHHLGGRKYSLPAGKTLYAVLDAYAAGKLISTAGLPALPEGFAHTGHYRRPRHGEWFIPPWDGPPQQWTEELGAAKCGRLIVRQKDTTEQPSPTGAS